MRFSEINVFGVYIAPIALPLAVAWVIAMGLRWIAAYCGLLRCIWHPALFIFSVYMIVLSSLILLAGR